MSPTLSRTPHFNLGLERGFKKSQLTINIYSSISLRLERGLKDSTLYCLYMIDILHQLASLSLIFLI